ncbi:MAG: transposase [Patescibacteria group bacterium]|jgi:REP element-mobilizing transposase RayT
MFENSIWPVRRPIRLPAYDYSRPATYFITFNTRYFEEIFGTIENNKMQLNDFGKIIEKYWIALPNHFPYLRLDTYIIMPNHLHGIIEIIPRDETAVRAGFPRPLDSLRIEATGRGTRPLRRTLGQIIAYFKYQSTKRINEIRQSPGKLIWHRSFHDRIIRNDIELHRIRVYIRENPRNWSLKSTPEASHAIP